MRKLLLIFGVILFISVATAISCNKNISNSWIQGQAPPTEQISCLSQSNQTNQVFYSGSHFSVIPNSILPNQTTNLQVIYNDGISSGNYTGWIFFSDGTSVSMSYNITPTQQQTGCQINPSLVSYTQSIQQGTQIPLPKITFSPISCNGELILTPSSVSVQGGIITPVGQKPVFISSVVSDGIFLNIDTTGLNTQTYTSYLNINAFQKTFQIPFTIIVTSGTSPNSNFSIDNLPKCSLTSTVLNLNGTYSLVCTSILPDITIFPESDNEYIIGKNVETTSNQYSWIFSAKKYGNTIIKAKFFFRNAPVGDEFKQEVKISSSGLAIPGTNLRIAFTPSFEQIMPKKNVILQIVDNKTGSLVNNPEIYIDAVQLISIGYSFNYSFDLGRNYSIRARSPGYEDLVDIISVTAKELNFSISPESGDSSTVFSVSELNNATLYLDGTEIQNPYSNVLTAGNHTIKAKKDGYIEKEINLLVEESLTFSNAGTFEKGVRQTLTLNKNVSWEVVRQETPDGEKINIVSGTGSIVDFNPDKAGIYTIQYGDKSVLIGEIKSWNGKIFKIHWIWWTIGIILVIIFIIYIRKRRATTGDLAFSGNVNN
jgi:hypothetical protein